MIKLEELSASELGFLVNEGKIKPKEVVKYFEERILKRNESINAYVYTKFEEAYEVAFKQEKLLKEGKKLGPFAGVPYALKDFLPNKIGWTNSHGGVKCLVALDEFNSAFNEAMEKAGGIPLGKTNAPSYGFRGTTDNKMYGPTSTPFNLKYNAGGSSGGSAAAVADGLALIAEGGDAGGSIRIPASYCNLYGFKAGIGTIPNIVRPDGFGTTHPYCFNGGLTKTVLDAAILLNYMKGYNPFDPFSNNNDIDYVKEMNKDIEVNAIVPKVVTEKVKNRLLEEKVDGICISPETEELGIYKSFNYEIFERRKSIVIAFDGNSPVLNLVQEAKNGKGKSKIYVNQENELLRQKADKLEGYVVPFEMNDNIAHKIFEENPEIL